MNDGQSLPAYQFHVEDWHCCAPGLDTPAQWREWLNTPYAPVIDGKSPAIKTIPPMLRRRFSEIGRYAASTSLALLQDGVSVPAVFASRHGDTHLTLSLLEDIGRHEPLSPTSFSLAVHNAVCGLLSIARKDQGPVTAIAASEGLLLQTLFEALGQLHNSPRVLCVIYDVPLPSLYQPYCTGDAFPYALGLLLNADTGRRYQLERGVCDQLQTSPLNPEPLQMLKLLTGLAPQISLKASGLWQLSESGR